MQAFILERITNDYNLETKLISNPAMAAIEFAKWIKQMPKEQDRQVAFRDANMTVAYVVTPHMPTPLWALIKIPSGNTPTVEFYARETEKSWRKKILEDLKSSTVMGGIKAACFLNMQTLVIAENFNKEGV